MKPEDAAKQWWPKLTRVLNSMPPELEVLVDAYGKLSLAPRGASRKYFEAHGDVDNVPCIAPFMWSGKGVENNGSSL